MNKSTKKLITAGLTLTSLAMAPMAFAESNTTTDTTAKLPKFVKQLTVSAINGNTLTTTDKDGKSYTIDISGADLQRKYKGTSVASEISVSDKIIVKGQDNGSTIVAQSVRDMSIHQKFGKTSGKVSNIGVSSFTLTTPKNVTITVNTTATTKFSGTKAHPLATLIDLKDGDQVMINGLKDNATNTETANSVHLFTNNANSSKAKLSEKNQGKHLKFPKTTLTTKVQ